MIIVLLLFHVAREEIAVTLIHNKSTHVLASTYFVGLHSLLPPNWSTVDTRECIILTRRTCTRMSYAHTLEVYMTHIRSARTHGPKRLKRTKDEPK